MALTVDKDGQKFSFLKKLKAIFVYFKRIKLFGLNVNLFYYFFFSTMLILILFVSTGHGCHALVCLVSTLSDCQFSSNLFFFFFALNL